MITHEFEINRNIFEKRKSSILQHKLRPTLKCYTIKNFVLDEKTGEFVFNKSFKKNTIRWDDPKKDKGSFTISKSENSDKIKVKITIY
jgi:hypothetical protein